MDRLKLQLEQKKTQLALLQEKKAEIELDLKKEKKRLLENFISVRDENKKLMNMLQCMGYYQQQPQANFMDHSQVANGEGDFQACNPHGEPDQSLFACQEDLHG